MRDFRDRSKIPVILFWVNSILFWKVRWRFWSVISESYMIYWFTLKNNNPNVPVIPNGKILVVNWLGSWWWSNVCCSIVDVMSLLFQFPWVQVAIRSNAWNSPGRRPNWRGRPGISNWNDFSFDEPTKWFKTRWMRTIPGSWDTSSCTCGTLLELVWSTQPSPYNWVIIKVNVPSRACWGLHELGKGRVEYGGTLVSPIDWMRLCVGATSIEVDRPSLYVGVPQAVIESSLASSWSFHLQLTHIDDWECPSQ